MTPWKSTLNRAGLVQAALWLSAALVVALVLIVMDFGRIRSRLTKWAPAPESHEDDPLSGEWGARFVVGDGETTDVVVDIGRLSSRWTGEFDILAFGAENYPVEVIYDPPNVTLHFSGFEADFEGTLSPEERVFRGVAKTIEHEHPLVFHRVGDVQFSKTLLELQAAVDDSTLVQELSANGVELRDRFNGARDQVRLVLLLSPT